MFQVQTMNKISPAGLSKLTAAGIRYGEDIEAPDGLLVRSAALHDLPVPPSLKAIARAGVGVNNIPVDRCTQAGVVVFNTPGANANAVKELVLGAMVATARNLTGAAAWVQSLKGRGADVPKLVEKGKKQFVGPELSGKTLGVIGLGAIGVRVANAAHALGMTVYGYDPYLSVSAAWGVSRGVRRAESLSEIYRKSDFITVHVPATKETRSMLNAEAFAAMKKGVRVFNFARGELTANADLLEAVKSGQVGSYTTDFVSDELLGVPHIFCTPHLGASTPESEDNCARMAAGELIDFFATGSIVHSVNFPDAAMPRSTDVRVTLIHKNVPNMLSQISAVMAGDHINIENMLNKSRGEIAYTIVDVSNEAGGVLEKLERIGGVVRVRVIH